MAETDKFRWLAELAAAVTEASRVRQGISGRVRRGAHPSSAPTRREGISRTRCT